MFDTNDITFNKIAEALLIDYTSVYYVDAKTNEYQWYSMSPEFHSLQIEPNGEDFFKNMTRDALKVVYEDDLLLFQKDMQKENLLKHMKDGSMQSIEYRLVIDGRPVWHKLRVIKEASGDDDYFILGVLNIDKEVNMQKKAETLEKQSIIFSQIASSLASHYDTLYYIDIDTNHYFEYSSTDVYKSLNIPTEGNDFFAESAKNIPLAVHPDDMKRVLKLHKKSTILKNLEMKKTFSSTYRLIINGNEIYCRNTHMWASDKKHLIVCIENITAEVIADKAFRESQKNSITYNAIAETLASHYDIIYYINIDNNNYSTFATNDVYGNLEIKEEGKDFFKAAKKEINALMYDEDKDRLLTILTKDYLLSALDSTRQFITEYRIVTNKKLRYMRLSVMFSSDHVHFIVGVENITEEIRKEEEQLQALRSANELARRDELTGAKNKNAYKELEENVQKNINDGINYFPFAIVVCDLNNLKKINDTLGHKAGDEYIQASAHLIFDTFSHSPVFRIGGDEFVVFLTERDYIDRDTLFDEFRNQILENKKDGNKPVIATGIAIYDPKKDKKVTDVFERADNMMYQNKKWLKAYK